MCLKYTAVGINGLITFLALYPSLVADSFHLIWAWLQLLQDKRNAFLPQHQCMWDVLAFTWERLQQPQA